MTTNTFETKEQYLAFRATWAKAAQDGKITAAHHVLLNILRGHPIERGFTPITKTSKLQNGFRINHGLVFAADHLGRMISGADGSNNWQAECAERFLSPFGDTFTMEMLASIELPEVKSLNSDFGKGKKIAKLIIEKKLKNITFADLDNLLEEAA